MTIDSIGILAQSLWDTPFLGNVAWQWLALTGSLLAAVVLGKILAMLIDRRADRLEAKEGFVLTAKLLRCIERPLILVLLALAMYAAASFMNFKYTEESPAGSVIKHIEESPAGNDVTPYNYGKPPAGVIKHTGESLGGKTHDFLPVWLKFCKMMMTLGIGWFLYLLIGVIEHIMLRWSSKTSSQLDDQIVPLIRKTLRMVVVVVIALFIAQNIFNWNIGALLAGLGLGGLAFALAAKDMLANLFGSVTIFADRPFQIGDRVLIDGRDGVIEEVGFRSTKLRTLSGHVVTVPNSVVANTTVENIAVRPYLKRSFDVGVTYDTPPKKMQLAIEILREMCEARAKNFVSDRTPRVYFTDFNADSLGINVTYWVAPVEWEEFLAFNHDFNMELLSRFNNEAIEFAFPTQTLYIKKDGDAGEAVVSNQ
ncbi:MAG: mechanosensitive ion channel [bacterium]|nr:mechanosensitive ion channel [bacterium]